MVVTMVEARVPADRERDLIGAYEEATEEALPAEIAETFLLRASDGDTWRIATVWRSREALDAYRASVETPQAITMFRAAGAEPTLAIFDVVRRAPAASA